MMTSSGGKSGAAASSGPYRTSENSNLAEPVNESGKIQHRFFTELPDALLYNILSHVTIPTKIAVFVTQSILPLCTSTKEYLETDALWELILCGYYLDTDNTTGTTNRDTSSSSTSASAYMSRRQRRESKRLRRTTAKYDVVHAHFVLRDRTDMALQDVAELAISKSPHPLSLARLRGILRKYGPHININQRSSIGGTFLVDCCRARYVKETVILKCAKELIEQYGASPRVPATEGIYKAASTRKKASVLPALVVAAARGMPSVVKYLVGCDGSEEFIQDVGTSRFRLFTKTSKSVSGTFSPLEFANMMRDAELENGATPDDLRSLEKCIEILRRKSHL